MVKSSRKRMLLIGLLSIVFLASTFNMKNVSATGDLGLQAIAHCHDSYEIKGYDSGGVYNTEYFTLYGTDDTNEEKQLKVSQYQGDGLFETWELVAEGYLNVKIKIEGSHPSNVSFNADSRQIKNVWGVAGSDTTTVNTGRILYRSKTGQSGSWSTWSSKSLQDTANSSTKLINEFGGPDKYVHIIVIYELRQQNFLFSTFYNIRADYCIYIC